MSEKKEMTAPAATGATAAAWTKEPPATQDWYWHWTGDLDHAPFPVSVMYSGTAKKCFVAMTSTHSGHAEWCDEYGGYWLKIERPSVKGAPFQSNHVPLRGLPPLPTPDVLEDHFVHGPGDTSDWNLWREENMVAFAHVAVAMDRSVRLRELREWLAATGALPKGASWIGELESIVAGACALPPSEWHCTRTAGHDGPCAAYPVGQVPAELKAAELTRSGLALMVQLKTVKDAHAKVLTDAYSALLWLYRRLPRAYEPPAPIARIMDDIGLAIGEDAQEAILERAEHTGVAPMPPVQVPTPAVRCYLMIDGCDHETNAVDQFSGGRTGGIPLVSLPDALAYAEALKSVFALPTRAAPCDSRANGNPLGLPSCGKPLCTESDHHPLCAAASQSAVNRSRANGNNTEDSRVSGNPAPAVQADGQLIVSTGNDEANCFSVVVAMKQGDQTTVLYSNRHTANGDSVGVAGLPAALACAAAPAARSSTLGDDLSRSLTDVGPDMLWDADDPDVCHDGADEFASAYAYGNMSPGDISEVKVQCADRMPDRKICIEFTGEGETPVKWKWIDIAAPAGAA